ncbi:MAG: Asp/Glu/hydantoin racemase [Bacteroidetes bacterium]|nr:Asp/Glu/hydantoin racemase [Bacteroidota bacterium]
MVRFFHRRTLIAVLLLPAAILSCTGRRGGVSDEPAIITTILSERESFYYLSTTGYPAGDRTLPVGVFDSGTGGLTVLEAILAADAFNNETMEKGSDSLPDFSDERFIYLADQANMPYGIYSSEGKTDLLVEHVIKDAQFLMSERYYASDTSTTWITGKDRVKAIVVACNTATAYGLPALMRFIESTGTGLKVIGVIDAGARGALQLFAPGEDGSIGVLATVGTVASGGYDATIRRMAEAAGSYGDIMIFSQGGHGIAEAVDGERDFTDRSVTAPRNDYRGPSLGDSLFRIERHLLDAYNFSFSENKMLCDAENAGDCTVMQINDPENYMRYHIVSLLEKIRQTPDAHPLKVIILGCTHYPYLTETINQVLTELRNLRDTAGYRYRDLMDEEVHLVDPSVNVATELYEHLTRTELYSESPVSGGIEFYISVPNSGNPQVKVDNMGRFTYEYKYGRSAGENQEYVKVVPFSPLNIPEETLQRLKQYTPLSYRAIVSRW